MTTAFILTVAKFKALDNLIDMECLILEGLANDVRWRLSESLFKLQKWEDGERMVKSFDKSNSHESPPTQAHRLLCLIKLQIRNLSERLSPISRQNGFNQFVLYESNSKVKPSDISKVGLRRGTKPRTLKSKTLHISQIGSLLFKSFLSCSLSSSPALLTEMSIHWNTLMSLQSFLRLSDDMEMKENPSPILLQWNVAFQLGEFLL